MYNLGKGLEILNLLLPQLSKDMREAIAPLLFEALASHISETEFMYLDLTWKDTFWLDYWYCDSFGRRKGSIGTFGGSNYAWGSPTRWLPTCYDYFPHPTLHQEGTLTHVFPHSHSTCSSQPPHVVDPPLQTPPRWPRRPRLSEDNQVALATRSKAHNGIPGRTLAPKAQFEFWILSSELTVYQQKE